MFGNNKFKLEIKNLHSEIYSLKDLINFHFSYDENKPIEIIINEAESYCNISEKMLPYETIKVAGLYKTTSSGICGET